MPLSLRYAARSDVGLVRQGNEDSGYAGPRLLAVADGMGGHAAGEVASSVTLAALAHLDDDDGGGDLLDALADAVQTAARSLGHAVDTQPELEGMGTTLTALLWAGNRIGLAHIGDSRAYLVRGDELIQLTRDHTYVQSLVDSGRITADEAASHPRRSLLTRALGDGNAPEPDLSIREVRAGDRFLVCSDGLSAIVSEKTIHEALNEATAPQEAVDRLVELALRGGGPDNITAIVADVVDLDAAAAPEVETLVVGAAGVETENGPSLRTPAGRAAATLRPETSRSSRHGAHATDRANRKWAKRAIAIGAVFVLAFAAVLAFGAWTRTQYYVGTYGTQVAIYRGLPQDVLGIGLSELIEVQQIDVATLPPTQQGSVADTIHASSLERARVIVEELQATSCADPTLPGCETSTPTASASPSATASTGTTEPTASPSPTVLSTDAGQP